MPSAQDPQTVLPSVLALRDLRQRIGRTSQSSDFQAVERLIRLDPPTVLRCLRAAAAPAYGSNRTTWTIPQLIEDLGPSLVRRALSVPVADLRATAPVRQLWLHSIASAMAARTMAERTGLMDPEQAYLLGLIHDAPLWLNHLRRPPDSANESVMEWFARWNLPAAITRPLEAIAGSVNEPPENAPSDPATLLRAAEFVAELGDFWHSEASDPVFRQVLLTAASRDDLLFAQNLRHEVHSALREVGLDPTEPAPDWRQSADSREPDPFPCERRGDVSTVVLTLVSCSKAATYRAVVTATTSAALRFMDFDRAWFVRWVRSTDRVVLRSKSDGSSRRVTSTAVTPTALEIETLREAHAADEPMLVAACRSESGLLHWIGADEALVVPMTRDFETPGFLLLDRATTARGARLEDDHELARTMSSTASLLIQNQLLKRGHQRAKKFALTDPLTRLFNRTTGMKVLEQELARSHRNGQSLTALMLDIDAFKQLNDRFGHLRGDAALRALADLMRQTVRRTDTVCRYGGEEFLVVLPETGPDEAAVFGARLATAVETQGQQLQLPLTVSIGMATDKPDDTVETLLQRADLALYASKALGKNRFSIDADI